MYIIWNLSLLLYITNAQPEKRFYYFNFSSQADWFIEDHGITVDFVESDTEVYWPSCNDYLNGACLRMRGASIISRVISTIGYHSIRIQIAVREYGLESGDYCYIQYRNKIANTSWINKNLVGYLEGLQLNATVNVFDNDTYNNQSSFQLRIGNYGVNQHDECYWDDLEVFGIPYTPSPTINNPSISPTNNPSVTPTNNPSYSPSMVPTNNPIIDTSTLAPTNNPTPRSIKDGKVNDNAPNTTGGAGSDSNDQQNNQQNNYMIYVIVGCAVGFILVIMCIMMGVIKYRKINAEAYDTNVNVINLVCMDKEKCKSTIDVAGECDGEKRYESGSAKTPDMRNTVVSICSSSIDEMFVVNVEGTMTATANPENKSKINVANDISSDSPDIDDMITNYLQWKLWNHNDLLKWILSLNNGVFIQYKDVLETSLKEENVRGSHLVNVDKTDIKGWGIKDFEHKQTLYDHIRQLLQYNASTGSV
eukprot:407546_1